MNRFNATAVLKNWAGYLNIGSWSLSCWLRGLWTSGDTAGSSSMWNSAETSGFRSERQATGSDPKSLQSSKAINLWVFCCSREAPEWKCYYFQSYDSEVTDNFWLHLYVCQANITKTQVSKILIAGGDKQYAAVRMCFIVPEECRIWVWQRHYVATYQQNGLLYR